jgi:drug/metabolite transporter (DMT)-like permease
VAGAVVLAPLGLWEFAAAPPVDVGPAAVLGVVYSGVLAAGVANVFVFNAIRLVGPTRVTSSQFLVPAGAVVLGAIFLAEPVTWAQVVGGGVIVLGVWLTRRPSVLPRSVGARLSSG